MAAPETVSALTDLIELAVSDPYNQQNTAQLLRQVLLTIVVSYPNILDQGGATPGQPNPDYQALLDALDGKEPKFQPLTSGEVPSSASEIVGKGLHAAIVYLANHLASQLTADQLAAFPAGIGANNQLATAAQVNALRDYVNGLPQLTAQRLADLLQEGDGISITPGAGRVTIAAKSAAQPSPTSRPLAPTDGIVDDLGDTFSFLPTTDFPVFASYRVSGVPGLRGAVSLDAQNSYVQNGRVYIHVVGPVPVGGLAVYVAGSGLRPDGQALVNQQAFTGTAPAQPVYGYDPDALSKVTADPQSVAGPVTFDEDVTGPDGVFTAAPSAYQRYTDLVAAVQNLGGAPPSDALSKTSTAAQAVQGPVSFLQTLGLLDFTASAAVARFRQYSSLAAYVDSLVPGAQPWAAGKQKAGSLVYNDSAVWLVKQDIANSQTGPTQAVGSTQYYEFVGGPPVLTALASLGDPATLQTVAKKFVPAINEILATRAERFAIGGGGNLTSLASAANIDQALALLAADSAQKNTSISELPRLLMLGQLPTVDVPAAIRYLALDISAAVTHRDYSILFNTESASALASTYKVLGGMVNGAVFYLGYPGAPGGQLTVQGSSFGLGGSVQLSLPGESSPGSFVETLTLRAVTAERWSPNGLIQLSKTGSGQTRSVVINLVDCTFNESQKKAIVRVSGVTSSVTVNVQGNTVFTGASTIGDIKNGQANVVVNDQRNGGGGSYTLPQATATQLGGIKLGAGLSYNSQTGQVDAAGGGGGGGGIDYANPIAHTTSATLTASDANKLHVLSGADFTLTLPTTPAASYRLRIKVDSAAAGLYTIDGNGNSIGGSSKRLLVFSESLELLWVGSAWLILSQDATKAEYRLESTPGDNVQLPNDASGSPAFNRQPITSAAFELNPNDSRQIRCRRPAAVDVYYSLTLANLSPSGFYQPVVEIFRAATGQKELLAIGFVGLGTAGGVTYGGYGIKCPVVVAPGDVILPSIAASGGGNYRADAPTPAILHVSER